jgi:hypothetical protein
MASTARSRIMALFLCLAAPLRPASASDLISPLVALPTDSIVVPVGTQARLFSAPHIVSSLFFDGRSASATALTADVSVAKLLTLDPAGRAATRTTASILTGPAWRSGMADGQDVLVTTDYAPAVGAWAAGLYRVAPNGTATPWPLAQGHNGTFGLAPLGSADPFLPAAVPAAVTPMAGTTGWALRANYTFGPIGALCFAPDGSLRVLSQGPYHGVMASVARDGAATLAVESGLLSGENLKGVALGPSGEYVVGIDYAPGTGNSFSTVYRLNAAGSYQEWGLQQSHTGISQLVAAPQGGYYFTDFENDNIWHISAPGEPETPVLSQSPAALWDVAVDAEGGLAAVTWIPGQWWSDGGVNAVYRVVGGQAVLAAQAPAGSLFYGIAAGQGGAFGRSFYVTDAQAGQVLRLEPDNQLTPVITGLPGPTRLAFDPVTGDMVVVCDRQYLVRFGYPPPAAPVASPPAASPGLFMADFENDNV